MSPLYDIFLKEGNGDVLWQGPAATIDEAKKRIRELATSDRPCDYIILDARAGTKVMVNSSEIFGHERGDGAAGGD